MSKPVIALIIFGVIAFIAAMAIGVDAITGLLISSS